MPRILAASPAPAPGAPSRRAIILSHEHYGEHHRLPHSKESEYELEIGLVLVLVIVHVLALSFYLLLLLRGRGRATQNGGSQATRWSWRASRDAAVEQRTERKNRLGKV